MTPIKYTRKWTTQNVRAHIEAFGWQLDDPNWYWAKGTSSIPVTCPNGHAVRRAISDFKPGLGCPVCKQKISSPRSNFRMGEKHYLGKLCPLGHDHDGTEMSLRLIKGGGCLVCFSKLANKKYVRQLEKFRMGEKHYLGKLCRFGHDHDGTEMSLRYLSHRNCVVCFSNQVNGQMQKQKEKYVSLVKKFRMGEKYYLGKLCPLGHDHDGTEMSLRFLGDKHCVGCRTKSKNQD